MSDAAFITMVFVLGIVWGGLLLLLTIAWRKEGKKQKESTNTPPTKESTLQ